MGHIKHRFRFHGVEDNFLYQTLIFVCRDCFMECHTERDEFYSILTEIPTEVNWDDLWR